MNLEMLRKLLKILGDIKLSEAVTWLEVEVNAEALRAEGRESEPNTENSAT